MSEWDIYIYLSGYVGMCRCTCKKLTGMKGNPRAILPWCPAIFVPKAITHPSGTENILFSCFKAWVVSLHMKDSSYIYVHICVWEYC